MKTILSALVALSALTSIAAPASAAEPFSIKQLDQDKRQPVGFSSLWNPGRPVQRTTNCGQRFADQPSFIGTYGRG